MILETVEDSAARVTPGAKVWRFISTPAFQTTIKILVSAALLYWLVDRVQLADVSAQLGGWRLIGLALLIQLTLPLVQTQRWRTIAATLGARLSYGQAARNVYIGQFFNQLLPSSMGGDAVRVWKLTPYMPVQVALSSVALERIVALLTVPVILVVGSGLLARIVPAGPFRWSLFAMMAVAGCGLVAFLFADRIPLPRALAHSRVAAIVLAMPIAARRLFSDPGSLVSAMLLSAVIHAGVGTSLWLLARNFDPDAPIAAFLLLAPLITMVTAVPVSVGGWGVREGAMITALSLVDIPPSAALTIAIEFGLIMLVVGVPGAALTLFGPTARPADPRQAANADAKQTALPS